MRTTSNRARSRTSGCRSAVSSNTARILSDHPSAWRPPLFGEQNIHATFAPDTSMEALTGYARRGTENLGHGSRHSRVTAERRGEKVRADHTRLWVAELHLDRFTEQLTTFASERCQQNFVDRPRVPASMPPMRGQCMAPKQPHGTRRDRSSDCRQDYAGMRKPNTGTVAALLAGVVILHLPGRFALVDHAVHGRRLTVARRNAFGDCEMPANYGSCTVSSH